MGVPTVINVRNNLCDVSDEIQWLDQPVPYYERKEVVDRYDSEYFRQGLISTISTMEGPTSGGLIDYILRNGLRSVLDLGCGAGAFYHLLKSQVTSLSYRGFDLSESQIKRAKHNFGDFFEVKDISKLTTDDFSEYDAVHMYSVLSFMTIEDQLMVLDNILSSNAILITSVGATSLDVRCVPQSFFANLGAQKIDDRPLLTAVNRPLKTEIDQLITRHPRYEIVWEEKKLSKERYVNSSGRAGGATLRKNPSLKLKVKTELAKKFLMGDLYYKGLIKPKGWSIPEVVPGVEDLKK